MLLQRLNRLFLFLRGEVCEDFYIGEAEKLYARLKQHPGQKHHTDRYDQGCVSCARIDFGLFAW